MFMATRHRSASIMKHDRKGSTLMQPCVRPLLRNPSTPNLNDGFPTLSSFTPNLSCAVFCQSGIVAPSNRLALHFGLLSGFRLAIITSDRVGFVLSYRLRHLDFSFIFQLGLLFLFSALAMLQDHVVVSKHIHIPEREPCLDDSAGHRVSRDSSPPNV